MCSYRQLYILDRPYYGTGLSSLEKQQNVHNETILKVKTIQPPRVKLRGLTVQKSLNSTVNSN